MERALGELVIVGVVTSRELHLRILADAEFRSGAIDIHWLERRLETLTTPAISPEVGRAAAVGAALLARGDAGPRFGADGARGGQQGTVAAEGGDGPTSGADSGSTWIATARREGVGQ